MMNRIAPLIFASMLAVLLSAVSQVSIVYAQSEDLGLCPFGFDQRIVTTGFVECYRRTTRDTLEEAELGRLQREAVCNANPNSRVTSSAIVGTSNGRFEVRITCTVSRSIPPGTVLCPANSEEVYRAFDTLVCQDFGNPFPTIQQAQISLNAQIAACNAAPGGSVLESELTENIFTEDPEDLTFFSASVACRFTTAATNNIECPFRFDEVHRDDNIIVCEADDQDLENLAAAEVINQSNQSICTDTTAGLGLVNGASVGQSSNLDFFSLVVCNISIPRYGDFADQSIIRACDATCTEEIQQARACLNGGVIGGPGCIEASTQAIERSCNTGTKSDGLCPLIIAPSTIIPLLLLDDEEDDG